MRHYKIDVSGGDEDDGNGGDDDPGGGGPHGGGGSAKDRLKEVKDRFGIDDTVGDVDAGVEGDVKGIEPTAKPAEKPPDCKTKGQKGRSQCPLVSNRVTTDGAGGTRKLLCFKQQMRKGDPGGKMWLVVQRSTVKRPKYLNAYTLIQRKAKITTEQ